MPEATVDTPTRASVPDNGLEVGAPSRLTMQQVLGVVDVGGFTVILPDDRYVVTQWRGAEQSDSFLARFPRDVLQYGAFRFQLWAIGPSRAFESDVLDAREEFVPPGRLLYPSERRVEVTVVGLLDGTPVAGVECVLTPARLFPRVVVSMFAHGFFDLKFPAGVTDAEGRLSIPVPNPLPGVRIELFQDGVKVAQSPIIEQGTGSDVVRIELDDRPRVGYAVLVPEIDGLASEAFDALARNLFLGDRAGDLRYPIVGTQQTASGHWLLAHLPQSANATNLRVFGAEASGMDVMPLPPSEHGSIEASVGFQALEIAAGASYAVKLTSPVPVKDGDEPVTFGGTDLWTTTQSDPLTLFAWGWDATRWTHPVLHFECPLDEVAEEKPFGVQMVSGMGFKEPGYYERNRCTTTREVVFEFGPRASAVNPQLDPLRVALSNLDTLQDFLNFVTPLVGGAGVSATLPVGRYELQMDPVVDPDRTQDLSYGLYPILFQFEILEPELGDTSPVTIQLP
ncbi:MAG: hypothetical protein GC161_06050 [Planctomycetaceae bacterium]|nr:hypothetical protein [Planctomycetaceae bacterium]